MKDKEYHRQYYLKNRAKRIECVKQCNIRNPERKLKYMTQYRINNKEKVKESQKKWRDKNEDYYRKYHREKQRERHSISLKCNLNHKISISIYHSLKGNKAGRHWEILIGYTLKKLIYYLKQTIPTNYTWQDYLQGKLHIDHIIPIRAFVFNKPEDEEFKQCWSLCNLRLLPKYENISKSDSINNPILLGLLLKEVV